MANRYIRLISSGSSLDFKFKAVQWKPIYQKAQQVERTIGGGIDVHTGAVQQTYRYILRVSYDYQEGEEDFGRYSDLIKFYALNNPNAVDSNLLTFFDHFGNEHQAWMTSDVSPDPITSIIDGECAWYMVPIEITVKPTALEPEYLVPIVPE